MRGKRWYGVALAVAGGVALALIPANAMAGWDTGAGLKTGDTVCGPRFQTTSGRMYGSIVNSTGTATIRVASTLGGPETVVFSQTGINLNVNKTVTAPPGSYVRGCIKITAHTASGDRVIYKGVNSGGSFGANPLRQHIGLGSATESE